MTETSVIYAIGYTQEAKKNRILDTIRIVNNSNIPDFKMIRVKYRCNLFDYENAIIVNGTEDTYTFIKSYRNIKISKFYNYEIFDKTSENKIDFELPNSKINPKRVCTI